MSPVHKATTRTAGELAQDRLRVAHHFLERLVGSGRVGNLHHLDLVELVLPDYAARVLAIAAGLDGNKAYARSA